jgi:hypothetical protein
VKSATRLSHDSAQMYEFNMFDSYTLTSRKHILQMQVCNVQYITGEIKTVTKYSTVKLRSQLLENEIFYFVVPDNLSLSILHCLMIT